MSPSQVAVFMPADLSAGLRKGEEAGVLLACLRQSVYGRLACDDFGFVGDGLRLAASAEVGLISDDSWDRKSTVEI